MRTSACTSSPALYRNHLGLADLCDTGIIRRCIFVTDKVPNPGSLVPNVFVLALRRIRRLQVIFARVKSEKTILASVIGLRRTNSFQSPFPRSGHTFVFHFLFFRALQGEHLHVYHRFTIFVDHASGNDPGGRHAKKNIADPFARSERQHRPLGASLRLVRLGHKTRVDGSKLIAAWHYVLEDEMAVAVSNCRVQLCLPRIVFRHQR